ncbi:hypothetical protein DL98DRAFT_590638 [Cadophora sp. DSE1049]|nr:hypothetical protein DL98DRAFT_590638 [Cadophora sp. DSE1049]
MDEPHGQRQPRQRSEIKDESATSTSINYESFRLIFATHQLLPHNIRDWILIFDMNGNIRRHRPALEIRASRPRGPLAMEPATTFHSFKNLPNEIKHQIWTYTCKQEARNNARIQIEAKNHWTLWRCTEPLTFHDDGTFIYVSREHDTFYFADGVPTDFWILSSFVGIPEDMSEFEDGDPKKVEKLWRECTKDINHFAVDWWCWLKATIFCDWTWMGRLGLSEQGDLTIVIKNPNDPGPIPEFSPYVETRLKEVTSGTVRAEAVDAILTHIKYKEMKDEFPYDTQTVKLKKPADEDNCSVPALRALAVVGPDDDENSKEDEEYLEVATRQARYHRVKHDMRNLLHEQRTLARKIKEMDIQFPDDSLIT